VSELQALVSEHPLRERLRGQLMLALYAQGRQTDALEVYRSGRDQLNDVGLEPDPSLRELERAILRHEVTRPGPTTAAHVRRAASPRRIRAAAVVGAALVVALASLAGGLVASRGDSPAALAGVAPNSLGVIEPEDNALVAEIPVGQRPVSVAAGLGAVWVANAGDGTVSRVDARERRLVENIRARTAFGSVRVGRGRVWAVGRAGRSPNYEAVVSSIDPDVGAVTTAARYPVVSIRYDETPGVVAGFRSIWLTGGWQVLRLDARGRLVESPAVFSSARGIAVGEGSVWVGDVQHPASGASTVVRIDPQTAAVGAEIPVAAEVAAIAVGGGAVWVASDDGTLTRIDPTANVVAATVELGGALSDVAVGLDAVWVANSGARNVARIDPATNDVVATIPTRARPEAIEVGEGVVWVTAY
jgi:YVTN family beta-propeller protein